MDKPVPHELLLRMIAPDTEYSLQFLQGMLDRMTVSFYKYGPVVEGYPTRVDAVQSLQMRLERYAETGNTEFLIDAANFAMIEFMRPRHPEAHFKPTDSSESPGRMTMTGRVVRSEKNNRLLEVPVADGEDRVAGGR
jgi:hypothetical protein